MVVRNFIFRRFCRVVSWFTLTATVD